MFPPPRQAGVDALVVDEEKIAALRAPTLILHGRDDQVIPLATSLRLHQLISPSQLHVFGECGHWVQIEQRDRFVALVSRFLAEQSVAEGPLAGPSISTEGPLAGPSIGTEENPPISRRSIMRIAILGAGNVGGGLAAAAVKAGHDVVLTAGTPAHAVQVAIATGARAATTNTDAVAAADLVVLAIPHGAVADIAWELADRLAGKIVVDATNPLNASYTDLTTTGVSAGESLQELLPGVAVVKAFNTTFAARYANPTEGGAPVDVYLAGDDAAARRTVGEFAASLGFRVIDSGGMRLARALEEMAFLNISLNAGHGWPFQSAWKLVGPTARA